VGTWQELSVGDRIRIVRLHSEWTKANYYVPPRTRRLYERLIARRRSVRVCQVDEWGLPWIHFKFREGNGAWVQHYLAVNDDSWVRVKRRIRAGKC
jgi:hypothetical protein